MNDSLITARRRYSIERFRHVRGVLEPLFARTMEARSALYADLGTPMDFDDIIFRTDLTHVYAGALLGGCNAFFQRMARWAGEPVAGQLNRGYAINGVGITLAFWAGYNNHKHHAEWQARHARSKPFTEQQRRSMEPLAFAFNDSTIAITEDVSANVLHLYSDGSYDVLEQRVVDALHAI